RSDEWIALPRPLAAIFQRLLVRPEPPATGGERASLCIAKGVGRKKVHRRLVIAESRQHARQRHLDRTFFSLFDAPFETVWIADGHAGADAVRLHVDERVDRLRIGRALGAPWTIEDVGRGDVQRSPKLRHALL